SATSSCSPPKNVRPSRNAKRSRLCAIIGSLAPDWNERSEEVSTGQCMLPHRTHHKPSQPILMSTNTKNTNMITRRKFVTGAATVASSAAMLNKLQAQVQTREPDKPRETTAAANKNTPLLERVDPKPVHSPGE